MTGLSPYNPIQKNLSSVSILKPGRLNGDYGSGFEGTFKSELDKHSAPVGAAANQSNPHIQPRTISMRKTIMRANGEQSYAEQMYEDMLYDEYATAMTKNAGFGLADQMYLQLSAGGVDVNA